MLWDDVHPTPSPSLLKYFSRFFGTHKASKQQWQCIWDYLWKDLCESSPAFVCFVNVWKWHLCVHFCFCLAVCAQPLPFPRELKRHSLSVEKPTGALRWHDEVVVWLGGPDCYFCLTCGELATLPEMKMLDRWEENQTNCRAWMGSGAGRQRQTERETSHTRKFKFNGKTKNRGRLSHSCYDCCSVCVGGC